MCVRYSCDECFTIENCTPLADGSWETFKSHFERRRQQQRRIDESLAADRLRMLRFVPSSCNHVKVQHRIARKAFARDAIDSYSVQHPGALRSTAAIKCNNTGAIETVAMAHKLPSKSPNNRFLALSPCRMIATHRCWCLWRGDRPFIDLFIVTIMNEWMDEHFYCSSLKKKKTKKF